MAYMNTEHSVLSLVRWIWLQGWIQEGETIPSAKRIAKVTGTSVRQIMRAMHCLRDMGFLEIRRGAPVHVVNLETKNPSLPVNTVFRREGSVPGLVNLLREGIARADFRSGEVLPKASWLCREWHVSTRSLAMACRLIATEGLLHKEGKNWIVGLNQERGNDSFFQRQAEQPTILILCNRPEEWPEFHYNFMEGLVRSLGAEADRCAVRFQPVLTGVEKVDAVFPSGREAIRTLRRELGSSYLGTLLTPLRCTLPDFEDWCAWLCRLGKVVWLQDNDPDHTIVSSPRFLRVNYGDWVPQGILRVTDLALDVLQQLGHHRMLFACNREEDFMWFRSRAVQLQEKAAYRGLSMHIWEKSGMNDMQMVDDLLTRKESVWLMPNDRYAVRVWKILQIREIRVPRDLSLLSFDNLAERKPFPISTIDFGMSLLGYQILHWILGDVPIRLSRKGMLCGNPKLVDEGSLGVPRYKDR